MLLRLVMPLMLTALLGLTSVGFAYAADGSPEPSTKVKEPYAAVGSPGVARFKSKTEFASIDMLCLHLYFDASDPLDPGESLIFSPASLLPVINGPGFMNIGSEPQYSRTLCNLSYEGDIFIPPFLDGKETFLLVAETGSVRISRIDVEVFGIAMA